MPARALVCLLAAGICFGAPSKDAWERLADAGKLWAWIHYTHPQLALDEIDWDRAFADAAPAILAAETREEYEAVVRKMLAALQDQATHLADDSRTQPPGEMRDPAFRVTDDGILVYEPGVGYDPSAFNKLVPAIRAELMKPSVKAMVVDARRSPSFYSRWSDQLSGHSGPGVSAVRRRWAGYPPPVAFGSGSYSATLETAPGPPARAGSGLEPKPLVVVVTEHTNVPQTVQALYSAGKAAIVCEGPNCLDAMIPQTYVPLRDGIGAFVRTHELVHADGTAGFIPNHHVETGGLEAALAIARAGRFEVPKRTASRLWLRAFAEKDYAGITYPDRGLRLLGAVRVWSVFALFFPYKHLIGENWDEVLPQALQAVDEAPDALAYHLAIARLVARTNDTHCSTGSTVLANHFGIATLPFVLREIENRPVVTHVARAGTEAGIQRGDVLISIDGADPSQRMEELEPFAAASTPQSKQSRLLGMLRLGPEGVPVKLVFESAGGARKEVSVTRSRAVYGELASDRSGPVFRLLDERTGYVDLQRLDHSDVDKMFEMFEKTTAIVMDMRGYPRGTAWSIAPRLSREAQPVNAQFRRNLLVGGNRETGYFEQKLPPRKGSLYEGRTVMLVDERAISQSEHSGLMYRTANGTKFIGSPTAGANGDVTYFFAPGGIRVSFSGHDVRWPDGAQLQRVGLKPDVPVSPTIQGIRDGRDEVLEKALEYLRQ